MGAAGLLCTKTRYASIAAITHIRFHMCWQIRFALRATTNLGRAANRASAIACGAPHLRLKAAFQLLHSPTHNSPTFPSVLRGMERATASPSGFHRPPSHECGLRRTRTRLLRRLHEYSTTESRYCPFDVKAKVEQGPYDIIRVHSCRAQARIRARVARQADRPIAEKRCWRRRMPPGHATVRRD